MAYIFSDEILAKVEIVDENGEKISLNGISARETSADSIRSGLSQMLNVVGWQLTSATRIVNQDIVEDV